MSPQESIADLRRAAQLDGSEWRFGRMIAERLIENRAHGEALETTRRYYAASPANYIIGMLHARALLLNRRFQEAGDLLGRITVLPYEGSTEGRRLYRETQLMLAVESMRRNDPQAALRSVEAARVWPENLGAGKPYAADVDERLENWIESRSRKALGQDREAGEALRRITGFGRRNAGAGGIITALAWRDSGNLAEGRKLLSEWAGRQGTPALAEWGSRILDNSPVPLPAGIAVDEEYRILAEFLLSDSRGDR